MFKAYSSLSSLVITSRWFATSRLVAPVSVRLDFYGRPIAILKDNPLLMLNNTVQYFLIRTHEQLYASEVKLTIDLACVW